MISLAKMYSNNLLCTALSALTLLTPNALASPTYSTQKPLRVGVLYENVQLSDLSGLDVLGAQTPEIMAVRAQFHPEYKELMKYTTPMEFLYISSSTNASRITPDAYLQPTNTYDNAPLDLDILMIGGPNPAAVKEESLEYMRKASKKTKVILTTCTGAMWLAKSGVLDGKKATTNRGTLASAMKQWPKVQWQDQRWVIEDGVFEGARVWTSGGAGAGIDMIIEYADRTFNKKLVEIGCQGLDYPYKNRSQFYDGPFEVIPVSRR